jgi:hypothetical protein
VLVSGVDHDVRTCAAEATLAKGSIHLFFGANPPYLEVSANATFLDKYSESDIELLTGSGAAHSTRVAGIFSTKPGVLLVRIPST